MKPRVNQLAARRLLLDGGGTAGRIIDLANTAPAAGTIIIWHSDNPAFRAGGTCAVERLELPPPETTWDLRCLDCACEVITLIGVPPAVAVAAFGVAHSPSCPWLTRVLKGVA